MIHDSVPGKQRPPPGQTPPQPQVGIFAVGEEILVEEADLVKHFSPVEGDTGGRDKNLLDLRAAGFVGLAHRYGVEVAASLSQSLKVLRIRW